MGRSLDGNAPVIVVGATTVGWKCDGGELAWLTNAEQMGDVQFFAALEQDARGDAPFVDLIARLDEVGGETWRFTFDDGAEEITAANRIARICAGRNMVTDYAVRTGAEWCLFLDTDLEPDADAIPKLLDVDWPIVGGNVPSYCLGGPVVEQHPTRVWLEGGIFWPREHKNGLDAPAFGYPVEQHWNTAGFLLVHRVLFRRLRWRVDPDAGMTDDPCYGADALALGFPTLVRKDVIGKHPPAGGVAAGTDLRIYR